MASLHSSKYHEIPVPVQSDSRPSLRTSIASPHEYCGMKQIPWPVRTRPRIVDRQSLKLGTNRYPAWCSIEVVCSRNGFDSSKINGHLTPTLLGAPLCCLHCHTSWETALRFLLLKMKITIIKEFPSLQFKCNTLTTLDIRGH